MGKKGTKRKTQWRTLPIAECPSQNLKSALTKNYSIDNNNVNLMKSNSSTTTETNYVEEAMSQEDDCRTHKTHSNPLYLKRKSSASSNYYRNDYRNNSSYSYYSSKHNSTSSASSLHSSSQYSSYRRRQPFSSQQNGSTRYSSYGAERTTSRGHRTSMTSSSSNRDACNATTKQPFNEDDYTRISTPRQDVIFKKGYFSQPKKSVCSTDTNTTSSAAASIVSAEESVSALSVPSLSPEQCSSLADSLDPEQGFVYSFIDQNGVVYSYVPNGFDQYGGQMMMLPYGYPPYMCSPDVSPTGSNEESELNRTSDESNEISSSDLNETKVIDEVPKDASSSIVTPEKTSNAQDNNDNKEEKEDDEATTSAEVIEATGGEVTETSEETKESEQSSEAVQNIPGQFYNYGYPPYYQPQILYPFMIPQQFVPVYGNEFDIPAEEEYNEELENQNRMRYRCRKKRRNMDGNSTGVSAATSEYSEDESEQDEVHSVNESNETMSNKTEEIEIEKPAATPSDENEHKEIALNANVKEFIPRGVIKSTLNANVREFLPRNHTDSARIHTNVSSTNSPAKKSIAKKVKDEDPLTSTVQKITNTKDNETVQPQYSMKQRVQKRPSELTLAEKIKQKLAEESMTIKSNPETYSRPLPQRKNARNIFPRNDENLRNPKIKGRKGSDKKIPEKIQASQSTRSPISQPSTPSYAQIANSGLPLSEARIIRESDSPKQQNIPNQSSDKNTVEMKVNDEPITTSNSVVLKENSPSQSVSADTWQTVKPRSKRGKQVKERSLDESYNEDLLEESVVVIETIPEVIAPIESPKRRESIEAVVKLEEITSAPQDLTTSITATAELEVVDVTPPPSPKKKTPKTKSRKTTKKTIDKPTKRNKKLELKDPIFELPKKTEKTNLDDIQAIISADPNHIDFNQIEEPLAEAEDGDLNETEFSSSESDFTFDRVYLGKGFGRNPMDILKGFDYKYKSQSILKEEEEMVLSVIKSLNSCSTSSPPKISPAVSIVDEDDNDEVTIVDSNKNDIQDSLSETDTISDLSATEEDADNTDRKNTEGETITQAHHNNLEESYIEKLTDETEIDLNSNESKFYSESKSANSSILQEAVVISEAEMSINSAEESISTENPSVEFAEDLSLPKGDYAEVFPEEALTKEKGSEINANRDEDMHTVAPTFCGIVECINGTLNATELFIEDTEKAPASNGDEKILNNDINLSNVSCKIASSMNGHINNSTEESDETKETQNKGSSDCKIVSTEIIMNSCPFEGNELKPSLTATLTHLQNGFEESKKAMESEPVDEIEQIRTVDCTLDLLENADMLPATNELEYNMSSNDSKAATNITSEEESCLNIVHNDFVNNSIERIPNHHLEGSFNKVTLEQNALHSNSLENSCAELEHTPLSLNESCLKDLQFNSNGDITIQPSTNEDSYDGNFAKNILLLGKENILAELDNIVLPKLGLTNENGSTDYAGCVNVLSTMRECSAEPDISAKSGLYRKASFDSKLSINSSLESEISRKCSLDAPLFINHSEDFLACVNGLTNLLRSRECSMESECVATVSQETDFQEKGHYNSEYIADAQYGTNNADMNDGINTTNEFEEQQIALLSNHDTTASVEKVVDFADLALVDVISNGHSTNNKMNLGRLEEDTNKDVPRVLNTSISCDRSSGIGSDCEDNQPTTPRITESKRKSNSVVSLNETNAQIGESTQSEPSFSTNTAGAKDSESSQICMPDNVLPNLSQPNSVNCDNQSVSYISSKSSFGASINDGLSSSSSSLLSSIEPKHDDLALSTNTEIPPHGTSQPNRFPLTEAVRQWLVQESKEPTPEPLLRIPDNPCLKDLVEKQLQTANVADNEDWSTTEESGDDRNDCDDGDDGEWEDEVEYLRKSRTNPKNLKSNPLHVSSCNAILIDTDSDYNSDNNDQHCTDRNDDNTCERVAKILSEDNANSQPNKNDLLEYWDDEFIRNPKKWLAPPPAPISSDSSPPSTTLHTTNVAASTELRRSQRRSASAVRDSKRSSSTDLEPYESVYGKTINYNQLIASNYEFLSNNILSPNENDKTSADYDLSRNATIKSKANYHESKKSPSSNNNFYNDNNIKFRDIANSGTTPTTSVHSLHTNSNNENCLKPPEVCCILM